jgi:hypothetical protein
MLQGAHDMLRDHLVVVTTLIIALTVASRGTVEGQPKVKAEEFIVPTREDFLRGLKLEQPELAAVKAALDRGDIDKATVAYISYFRTKAITSPLITDWSAVERDAGYKNQRAEDFLKGFIRGSYNVYEVPATGLDWHNAPLVVLTSFHEFSRLSLALHHSGDVKYLRAIVDHGCDYMNAYPIEQFVGKDSKQGWIDDLHVGRPWRWGAIAERPITWSPTLALIRKYPQVTDEELATLLQRLYQEVAYLRTQVAFWVDRGHNAGGRMILAMATACGLFEDFKVVDEWLAFTAASLAQYVDHAYYPDGLHKELTLAYWASLVLDMTKVTYALRDAEGIEVCCDRAKAMATAAVALAKPTGGIPSYGDLRCEWSPRMTVHAPLLDVMEVPWLDTMLRDTEGPFPPFTEWPVPGQEQWSGYYTMRSGWDRAAKYMMIDGGPWGTGHSHGDKLSFVVTAHEADFVVDPISTKYRSNEPDAFISRQQAGFLHNTITIDGVDEYKNGPNETKELLNNTWEHGDNYSLFVGTYSFEPVKAARWQRRVLFVEKSYWLLQDVLKGKQAKAEIEQNFQFGKDIEIEFQENVTIAKAPNGARLVIVPLSGALKPELNIGDKTSHTTYWYDGKPKQTLWYMAGEPPNHGRGWVGHGRKLLPAPAVTYVGEVRLPEMLTMALVPIAPDGDVSQCPQIVERATGEVTTWSLPVQDGVLEFSTSVEECHIVKP